MFRKEFLLENEQDQNWNAWDHCKMENLTLTQYISKYREVSLKLDGLDDFQRVRGFIRGLNNEYKAKVKTQYPKTLEEAIKSAQIFDDTFDKTQVYSKSGSSMRTNVSSATPKAVTNNHKRKDGGSSGKEFPNKLKQRKGKLTQDELARARREKLCFNCLFRKACTQRLSPNSRQRA